MHTLYMRMCVEIHVYVCVCVCNKKRIQMATVFFDIWNCPTFTSFSESPKCSGNSPRLLLVSKATQISVRNFVFIHRKYSPYLCDINEEGSSKYSLNKIAV